jgi:hypothetical protein
MPDTLLSFTPFPRLPRELQIKIWEHSLQPPRVVPRVIRAEYRVATDSFTYAFPIVPALEVCRLSREVARKAYLSLVLSSASPVYFNPDIDFLYCKSPFDPLNPSPTSPTPLLPTRPVLPFLDPQANVSAVRFLVLDRAYWVHRTTIDITCPIRELREFRNIQEIFLVVPPLEQWRERTRALLSAFPHRPGDPRSDLDKRYAEEVARDVAAPSAAVPGFRIYLGNGLGTKGGGSLEEQQVTLCFGSLDIPPDAQNPFQTGTYCFDEYWATRKLPIISDIRIVSNRKEACS